LRRKQAGLFVTAAAVAAFLLLLSVVASDEEAPSLQAIAARAAEPPLSAALAAVDTRREALIEAWVAIASVPASSGEESARAALVEKQMRDAGLESVAIDDAGNVSGTLPGEDRQAKAVVVMAHMDTVGAPGADFGVRRGEGRLTGIGIRDDSSGLAALLAASSLAAELGIRPPTDVVFVASVAEETGLNGARAYLDRNGDRVGAFVAVDGYLGQVSYAATAITWMKMHFLAAGAHTLRSHEAPSATLAAAKAIERVYAIPVPRRPERVESWLNVGMMGGGEVPNAQARDAWFTVDLRSNDAKTAADLERRIRQACEKAAADVGVRFEAEDLQRLEAASIDGHRGSRLVLTTRAVLGFLGWPDVRVTPRGTADHNVALLRGIPAIAIGVTTGDGAHTPDEYADTGPYTTGIKQLLLLISSPLY